MFCLYLLALALTSAASSSHGAIPGEHKTLGQVWISLRLPQGYEAPTARHTPEVVVPRRSKKSVRKASGGSKFGMGPLGRLGMTAAMMLSGANAASTACNAKDGFHPLTYVLPGFVHQVDSQCAGVVRQNGRMLDAPLLPGLHFTPMKWFGYHITDVLTIPDEDTYDNIATVTKDHITYNFDISVTNEVTSQNIVRVVRRMGFDYDQKNLKFLVNNAVKEVIKGLNWMDIEVHKATELNELFAAKIREELVEKFQELGSAIEILSTTVQKVACGSPGLQKNLREQAEYESAKTLETKKREAEAEVIKTTVQTAQARHAAAEALRQADADRKMATAKADKTMQEIINQQKIDEAKAESEASQVLADQRNKELQQRAKVHEDYPGFTQHLNNMEVAKSMLTPNTKLVITTSTFDNLGNVFSTVANSVGAGQGWMAKGFCKVMGNCPADYEKTEQ